MTAQIPTEYANTDFDLESATAFDTLAQELDKSCCLLHHSRSENGIWFATVEAEHGDDYANSNAEKDILTILDAIRKLSPTAQAELNACSLREFNLGFHCGDTWAYGHKISAKIVEAIAQAHCSLAITLYPAHNNDGESHHNETTASRIDP